MASNSKKASREAAIAKLAASKRTGAKLSSLVEHKEEESIYKEINETEYAKLVASRRSQDDFVVDDDGLGYADDGEEHFDEDDYDDGADDDGVDGDLPPEGYDGDVPTTSKRAAKISSTTVTGQKTLIDFANDAAAVDISKAAKKAKTTADIDMDALFNELDETGGNGRKGYTRTAGAGMQMDKFRSGGYGGFNPFASNGFSGGVDSFSEKIDPAYQDYMMYGDVEYDRPVETVEAVPVKEDTASGATRATGRLASGAVTEAPSKVRAALAAAAAAAAQRAKALEDSSASGLKAKSLTGSSAITDGWIGESADGDAAPTTAESAPVSASTLGLGKTPQFELLPMMARKDLKDELVGVPVNTLLFYWLDAHEEKNNAGTVYLFGKIMVNSAEVLKAKAHNAAVKAAAAAAAANTSEGSGPAATTAQLVPEPTPQFASCCVTVSNMQRCMFVLPRKEHSVTHQEVTFKEVYEELQDVLKKHMKGAFKFAAKKVTRNYAFEQPDVPLKPADYLKVEYDARSAPLPSNLTGKTFSRVFGTNTSSLENFLLKRGIMGPCWLRLFNVTVNSAPISWCTYDVVVDNPKNVVPQGSLQGSEDVRMPAQLKELDAVSLAAPEVVVMSMSMKTVVHPKSHQHEIVTLSLVTHKRVNIDGPSNEGNHMLSAITIIRPLHQTTQPLPADLRPAISRLDTKVAHSLSIQQNERALLSHALVHIARVDPDVFVGHNIAGFDLDVFVHRVVTTSVPMWSRIGRLRRSNLPKATVGSGGRVSYSGVVAAGRLICDTYLAARELLRETTYTLTALSASQLNVRRIDVDPLEVPAFLTASSAEPPMSLMQHTENDCRLALKLMFKLQVLPLTKRLTNLAGNLWSRSLKGARAERIEYLLLHEFHKRKYIVPDKQSYFQNSKHVDEEVAEFEEGDEDAPKGGGKLTGTIARNAKTRGKPTYSGGLVLEPKKGLYDKMVLLLDFNSLYPSIIQEYNICFTTVERPRVSDDTTTTKRAAIEDGGKEAEEGMDEDDGFPALPPLPDKSKYTEFGVLPRVIQSLVHQRRQVKYLMNAERDPGKKQALDIQQKALKILANSMYGCLGFSFSRFFAKPLAALVTAQGREILQRTVAMAQNSLGCEVIYGDTDSIMIYTNTSDIKEVKKMGMAVKREVNKLYTHLEIEIDGIFSSMLLLKKKKYAALVVTEGPGGAIIATREMKGLDMVRRDWCILSREVGTQVLDIILSGKEREEIVDAIHALITQVAADVRAGRYPIEKFTITKGLNKAPQDYPDVKSQPHLQVALSMIKAGKPVNTGDHIPYVICMEPSAQSGAAASAGTAGTIPGTTGASSTSPIIHNTSPTASPAEPQAPVRTTTSNAALRAYHPDDVQKTLTSASSELPTYAPQDAPLHVDFEWYLMQQLLPPISRLCEPIAGTSQARLAECMGLDGSRFNNKGYIAAANEEEDASWGIKSLEEEFKDIPKLLTICSHCGSKSSFPEWDSLANGSSTARRSGLQCDRPECSGRPLPVTMALSWEKAPSGLHLAFMPRGVAEFEYLRARYCNFVRAALRNAVYQHQQAQLFCSEETCPLSENGTRNITLGPEMTSKCLRRDCEGRLMLDPTKSYQALYRQMKYLRRLFNYRRVVDDEKRSKREVSFTLHKAEQDVYDAVLSVVDEFFVRSEYSTVDLGKLFAFGRAINEKRNRNRLTVNNIDGEPAAKKAREIAKIA